MSSTNHDHDNHDNPPPDPYKERGWVIVPTAPDEECPHCTVRVQLVPWDPEGRTDREKRRVVTHPATCKRAMEEICLCDHCGRHIEVEIPEYGTVLDGPCAWALCGACWEPILERLASKYGSEVAA